MLEEDLKVVFGDRVDVPDREVLGKAAECLLPNSNRGSQAGSLALRGSCSGSSGRSRCRAARSRRSEGSEGAPENSINDLSTSTVVAGCRVANAMISELVSIVPVGLFGLTNTTSLRRSGVLPFTSSMLIPTLSAYVGAPGKTRRTHQR